MSVPTLTRHARGRSQDGAVVGRVLWRSKTVSDKTDPESSYCPSGTARGEGEGISCLQIPSDPARSAEKLKYGPRGGRGKRQAGPIRKEAVEGGKSGTGEPECRSNGRSRRPRVRDSRSGVAWTEALQLLSVAPRPRR
ncbi:hypothetical protein NDU88_001464 [Pleurodeles waltl]|uniref:Uncharacterized protein n=1 Tax=Pleurodeles waltl TaxID=8319 RepID=A0AAV7UWV4_PLEWA|nr:hypothetical protein NDU88_001464 [Pleurodeles waltl]